MYGAEILTIGIGVQKVAVHNGSNFDMCIINNGEISKTIHYLMKFTLLFTMTGRDYTGSLSPKLHVLQSTCLKPH